MKLELYTVGFLYGQENRSIRVIYLELELEPPSNVFMNNRDRSRAIWKRSRVTFINK
jgi:hypothetical protein